MRSRVVSMTTLVSLTKYNAFISPVNFFITKCSANIAFQNSILSVTVANGFSNWPFATCR